MANPFRWLNRRRTLLNAWRSFKNVIYGMTTYEMVRDLKKERARLEHLFVLITMGDWLGIPILPPYYALRLLPYVLPQIPGWTEEEKKSILAGWKDSAKKLLYGMAGHDMARYALKTRGSMEHLFILITMGDLLGIPILPPYYSLRLLPYVVPQISTWKRRMLRERDLTDALA
jgi:hypothetical protein